MTERQQMNVVFLPVHQSTYNEMRKMADGLASMGWNCYFFIAYPTPKDLFSPHRVVVIRKKPPFYKRFSQALLFKNPIDRVVTLLKWQEGCINDFFADINPRLVFLMADRHFYHGIEPALIKAANKRRVPLIVPSHGILSDFESLFLSRRDSPAHLVSEVEEETWGVATDPQTKRRVRFFDRTIHSALEKYGMRYQNPWVVGGCFADHVFVDGPATRSRYVSDGLAEEKIKITGVIGHDELYRLCQSRSNLRRELCRKHDLQEDKLVILALPQLWEQGLLTKEQHFSKLDEIFEGLAVVKKQLLVSLHPKMRREDYEEYLKAKCVAILDQSLWSVLPAADIFVCTNSSTITLSILCRIPVMILDPYGFDTIPFPTSESVVVVKNKEQIQSQLQDWLDPQKVFPSEKLRSAAESLAPFDGKSRERFLHAVKDLLSKDQNNSLA